MNLKFSSTESPYHDVSGLPDPYMEQMNMSEDQLDHPKHPPQPQQHMSLGGYDETLESGYSTPNSRNRRVIREIIV
jgi:echinoid